MPRSTNQGYFTFVTKSGPRWSRMAAPGPNHETVCRDETRIDPSEDLREDGPGRRMPPGRLPRADSGLRDLVREAAGTHPLRDDRAFARGFSAGQGRREA